MRIAIRQLTVRKLWVFISLGLSIGVPAIGGLAYLPQTGPVPLRFEKPHTNTTFLALSPAVVESNSEVLMSTGSENSDSEAETSPQPNAPAPAPEPAELPIPTAPIVPAGLEANTTPEEIGFTAPDPTTDHSLVTSQMLIEYFKPVAGSTNRTSASAFVPVAIRFTPPTPSPLTSRATYKVQ